MTISYKFYMNKLRLLITDDCQMVREGLAKIIIDYAKDIEVVGLAPNGEVAKQQVIKLRPDVVLMDIRMPCMDGIKATAAIKELCPFTRIIGMTNFDDDEYLIGVLLAGASAYLLKEQPVEEYLDIIRKVAAGQVCISEEIAIRLAKRAKLISQSPSFDKDQQAINITEGNIKKLAHREQEILILLSEGLDNTEIAHKLFLSIGTIKNYISGIYHKLGANDRTHAIILAKLNGYI